KFRSGDFDLEDKEGGGRSSALDDDELKGAVEANTWTTVRELAEHLDMCTGTMFTHRLLRIGK
ncbi:hypothetical protein Angca_008251, partial [Angiostrongylus cantonensis]